MLRCTDVMAKRKRKAPPTDPDRAGLETVTQTDADEARILREIAASDSEAPPGERRLKTAPAKTAPAKRKRRT